MEFCEYLRGAWGTTDLPGNLAGLILNIEGAQGMYGLRYAHRGRQIDLSDPYYCSVGFPKEQFTLQLEGEGPGWTGSVQEGTLFQAFYTLTLEKSQELADGISFTTILSFQRGAVRVDGLDESLAGPSSSAKQAFKSAWGPSLHPLRCPVCLGAEREVHLVNRNGIHRCQFCSFAGTKDEINRRYDLMRYENFGEQKLK